MKKFLAIAANTILIILIAIGVLIGFSLLPIKKNYKIYFVTSNSMAPTISTGSTVVSKPQDSYRVGDIITFKNIGSQKPSDTTTHRITKINQLENGQVAYVTKGDANDTEDDGYLLPDQIVGKMLFSVPLIGYLVGYIKTLPGLIFIIVVPATIIVFLEVQKIKNEVREIIRHQNDKGKLKKDLRRTRVRSRKKTTRNA